VADRLLVADASPLILLAKVGRLDLLGEQVVVPRAVANELLAGPVGDPARAQINGGRFAPFPDVHVPDRIQEWGLGQGESAVLALAAERPGAVAVVDDAQGRRCARAVGVQVVGTLGLVAGAVRSGHLPAASPLLRDLRSAGLWLDDALVTEVLHRILGEDWHP
jgi:predicted nucleic acid-binding protein